MATDLQKNISNSLIQFITAFNEKIFNPTLAMKKFPHPPSHLRVVFYLKRRGPVSISQAAKDLDISKPNMTPIIDKLITEDLVKRYNSPEDRRIIMIEATDKSNEILEKHKENMKVIICDKISSLSYEDLLELDEIIGRITTIINKLK